MEQLTTPSGDRHLPGSRSNGATYQPVDSGATVPWKYGSCVSMRRASNAPNSGSDSVGSVATGADPLSGGISPEQDKVGVAATISA